MITGTLMFDIGIKVDNEIHLKDLQQRIIAVVKTLPEITEVDQVDSDLDNSSETEIESD